MIIGNEVSSVEISLIELGKVGMPSDGDLRVHVAVNASASVSGGPFVGVNDCVWVGREQWAGFVAALRTLALDRGGAARVSAMSPAKYSLEVFKSDSAGHFAAEGWVGRGGDDRRDQQVVRVPPMMSAGPRKGEF